MIDPTIYLKDILEAIERFTEGIDFETFSQDDTCGPAPS